MPWISKITIILNKMLQVFMRTSQLHVRPVQQNFAEGFFLILRMRNVQIFMYRHRYCRPRFQIVKSV